MAYDFLGLSNLVLARFNEVALTSANFASSRGFQTQCKNAVNDSINYINQREFGWGFNHDNQTTRNAVHNRCCSIIFDKAIKTMRTAYINKTPQQ